MLLGVTPASQSFVKTIFTATVFRKLEGLSGQIEIIQKTLGDMQSSLQTNQGKLAAVQADINDASAALSRQQSTNGAIQNAVVQMQTGLSAAQTNLYQQAERLGDLSYWVENLFKDSAFEEISLSDTNRFMKFPIAGGGVAYGLLLKAAPITNSLWLSLKGHGPGDAEISISPRPPIGRFIYLGLYGYDENRTKILARYVGDKRRTNETQMGIYRLGDINFFGVVDGTNSYRVFN